MSDTRKLGFIGLGNIGGAVAANLVADGHEVHVFDTDPAQVQKLTDVGAVAAHSAREIAQKTEITFLSLPTPQIMAHVTGEWASGAPEDAILVDLTTNAPETVRRVGARLALEGKHLLEAPLTGGAPGARARWLVFMVGGDEEVFERVKPVLEKVGRATFYMGPLGAGNVAKLVNSLFAFTTTWVSLEGLAVCAKSGIDLRTMIDMVKAAGGGNFFIDRMVEGLNERGRSTEFALELAAKDAGLLLDVARAVAVPTPVAAEVAQALVAAKSLGFGSRDFTDLVEVIERLAGVKIQIPPPRS